jgi:glycosyltransferase involved in cell wall biosynthesis
LIRALARFHERPEAKPWRLVLMGWGPDLEKTRHLIGQLGLESKAVWERLCSKPLLRKRQRAADLVADQFVMPGYGTSVLESMAAGKPIVMARLDESASAYLQEPPPLVGAATEEEILAALCQMSDPAAREARGRASLAWVRSQHGFERVGEQYAAALWAAWRGRPGGLAQGAVLPPCATPSGQPRLVAHGPHAVFRGTPWQTCLREGPP